MLLKRDNNRLNHINIFMHLFTEGLAHCIEAFNLYSHTEQQLQASLNSSSVQ